MRKALETAEATLMESRQAEERLKLHYEANIEELIMKVHYCINAHTWLLFHDCLSLRRDNGYTHELQLRSRVHLQEECATPIVALY